STSALISGVKNFVSSGTSFVRGLPLSQVKSAKANGCAFSGFTVPVACFSVACCRTPTAVATLVPPGDAGSAEAALEAAVGSAPPVPTEADEELELAGA